MLQLQVFTITILCVLDILGKPGLTAKRKVLVKKWLNSKDLGLPVKTSCRPAGTSIMKPLDT